MNITLYQFSKIAKMREAVVEKTLYQCNNEDIKCTEKYIENLFKIVDARRDLMLQNIKCDDVEKVLMTERVYKTSVTFSCIHDSSSSTSKNSIRASKGKR